MLSIPKVGILNLVGNVGSLSAITKLGCDTIFVSEHGFVRQPSDYAGRRSI